MTIVFGLFEGKPVPTLAREKYLQSLRLIMEAAASAAPNPEEAANIALNNTLKQVMRDNGLRHSTQLEDSHVAGSLTKGLTLSGFFSLHGDYGAKGETPWIKTDLAVRTMAEGIEALGTDADKAAHSRWARDVQVYWETGYWAPRDAQQNNAPAAIIA